MAGGTKDKSSKHEPKDTPKRARKSKGDTIEVATSPTEPEAPLKKKKSRKRAADAEDEANNNGAGSKEKPAKRTKTSKQKTEAEASTADPVTEDLPAQPVEKKKRGRKPAVKKDKDGGLPSIEEATQNLLDAAKDKAAGAFKKADAIVVNQPVAEGSSTKGRKRKAADAAGPSDTVEVQATTEPSSTKKQKRGKGKGKGVVGSALSSVTDRVTSFLDSIGDAVGGKSIADAKAPMVTKDSSNGEAVVTKGSSNDEAAEEDEWEPDDQTADLIKGFETDEDDVDSGDEGFKEGKAIPKLPSKKGLTKKLKDAQKGDDSGVIYIGRIPHGFHEHQMRSYFSQFGTVNHVRLSRSKKTGRSKHYAFLEFASSDVAKIAADTMNNYLLFGHILKCSVVPKEQVHPKLWIGADKRFKTVPWARIENRKLNLPQGRSQWEQRIERERDSRKKKQEQLKEVFGYETTLPGVESVDSVPKKQRRLKGKGKAQEHLEAPKNGGGEGEVAEKTIVVAGETEDGMLVVSEEVKTKKGRKSKKDKEEGAQKTEAPPKATKAKKSKATKQDAAPSKTPKAKATEAESASEPLSSGKRTPKPTKRALEMQEVLAEKKERKKARKS